MLLPTLLIRPWLKTQWDLTLVGFPCVMHGLLQWRWVLHLRFGYFGNLPIGHAVVLWSDDPVQTSCFDTWNIDVLICLNSLALSGALLPSVSLDIDRWLSGQDDHWSSKVVACGIITVFLQLKVDHHAVTINCTVQVCPMTFYLDVSLVYPRTFGRRTIER